MNLNMGIYQIRNIITKFCYSGQSIELKKRERQHWYNLKNNRHENQHLQNSYNKHGKEFFVFEILVYCELEELTRYEQFFVDKYVGLKLSYNICRECVDSQTGVKCSKESREKMSITRKGKQLGKNNPFYGKKHTLESLNKMRESHKGSVAWNKGLIGIKSPKITKKDIVLQILDMLKKEMVQEKIAEELNVSQSIVSKIKSGFYNEIYNLPNYTFHYRKKLIGKDIVLKILELLESDISVKDILKKINVCQTIIYKVKNGWYDEIYDLKELRLKGKNHE